MTPPAPTPSAPTRVDHVDLDVLENILSYYIRIIERTLSKDLDDRLADLEVAKGKGKITSLLLIDSHPGIRPSVIAELLMRDRSATGRILDMLEGHGLITRRVSAEDSRAQELFITDKGAGLAAKVRGIVVQQNEDFFDRIMPREDQDTVVRILKSAYARLRALEG